MSAQKLPEVWQRGPVEGVPPLLQPVAHALLQAAEEIDELTFNLPVSILLQKPAGMASPLFHLQHLTGVLNRLFTYARGEALSVEQLIYLSSEGQLPEKVYTAVALATSFKNEVNRAISQLKQTSADTLTHTRFVGRAQIPSTVIGLYVHAAEHTMRHVGQLLVTVNVLKSRI